MRFAFVRAGVFLGSLLLFGCAAEDGPATAGPPDEKDTVGPSIHATLGFEGPSSVALAPGETRDISVFTSPADAYEIYFALLDAPSDTSLDAGHLPAGQDGRATVSLHAPSAPATFTLHAWIH